MNQNTQEIIRLSDGTRSSAQIAAIVGVDRRYVSKVQLKRNLPRLNEGGRAGQNNHQFQAGRRIAHDGYVLVTAPQDHPYARQRTSRGTKLITEHRLVMEATLGRYLLPSETVDHIDGLTLHNAPANLRLFQSNAEHLKETLAGQAPRITPQGRKNISQGFAQQPNSQRVDSHRQRKASGDVRLRQILLAALKLGPDSPYLLGTSHHTKKAGIDLSCRSTIERALADLSAKWELGQTLLPPK